MVKSPKFRVFPEAALEARLFILLVLGIWLMQMLSRIFQVFPSFSNFLWGNLYKTTFFQSASNLDFVSMLSFAERFLRVSTNFRRFFLESFDIVKFFWIIKSAKLQSSPSCTRVAFTSAANFTEADVKRNFGYFKFHF